MRIDPDEWVDAYNASQDSPNLHVWKGNDTHEGDGAIRDLRRLARLPEEEQMAAVQAILVGALHHYHSREEQWWEDRLRAPMDKWLRRAREVKE